MSRTARPHQSAPPSSQNTEQYLVKEGSSALPGGSVRAHQENAKRIIHSESPRLMKALSALFYLLRGEKGKVAQVCPRPHLGREETPGSLPAEILTVSAFASFYQGPADLEPGLKGPPVQEDVAPGYKDGVCLRHFRKPNFGFWGPQKVAQPMKEIHCVPSPAAVPSGRPDYLRHLYWLHH